MLASVCCLSRLGLMQPRSGYASGGEGGKKFGIDPLWPGRGCPFTRWQMFHMEDAVSAASATQQVFEGSGCGH
jgi:hypothetical protein